MKTSIFILFSTLFFTALFSQNIVSYSQVYHLQGQHASGEIIGYNTHFKQADSCKITFSSANDTISFWIKNAISDTYMFVKSPSLLNSVTWYKLSVQNSIDSVMNLSFAFTVLDTSFVMLHEYLVENNVGYSFPIGRSEVNSNSKISINLLNTKSIANVYDSAFYIQQGADTIAVDSITDLADYKVAVYSYVPTAIMPGNYDLFIYKNQDTLIIAHNALFVSNTYETQIDSISPDSIYNTHFYPWTIYVYGNKTHFTNDSNVIINEIFQTNGPNGGSLDSIQVINDTLLKFIVTLMVPVKQSVNPNSTLYIYNPTDGLLVYPMVVLIYCSNGNEVNDFKRVKLYPNPVKDNFWIESNEFLQEHIKVSIYSLSGALCDEYEFSNKQLIKLNSNRLSKGVYFVYIQGAKKIKVLKFVK